VTITPERMAEIIAEECDALKASLPAMVADECDLLRAMLLAKNKAYGNSVADPARVFAPGVCLLTALRVRMDDKYKRIQKGGDTEDSKLDLAGYLVLERAVSRAIKEDAKC
jgi:hypothetical protein